MKTLPNRYFSIYLVIFLNLTLSSCGNKNKNHVALEDADIYRNAVQNLTDIAVYDIFHSSGFKSLCLSEYCGL